MYFEKHVKRETREMLQRDLKEYAASMTMTKKERRELHAWVSQGRSPYDNGDYIFCDDGYPVDFISVLRTIQAQMEPCKTNSDSEPLPF